MPTSPFQLNIMRMIHELGLGFSAIIFLPLFLSACSTTLLPLDDSAHYSKRRAQLETAYSLTKLPRRAMQLPEAIAHALKRNASYRVELLEEVAARYDLSEAEYSLLPSLLAKVGYNTRSKPDERSNSSLTKEEATLELSFDLLDFRVGQYAALQTGDRLLAAAERRRGVLNRLVWQTETAFWRAALAQQRLNRVRHVLQTTEAALKDSQASLTEGADPLTALQYQRTLIGMMRTLRMIEERLLEANSALAELLGLSPNTVLEYELPAFTESETLDEKALPSLERLVLTHRSDLRELAYQERIGIFDIKRAITEMMPSLSVTADLGLTPKAWVNAEAAITKNLVALFSDAGQRRRKRAEVADKINRQRALVLTMAAMTQVHASYWRWQNSRELYLLANRMSEINARILTISRNRAGKGLGGDLEVVRTDTEALLVDLERDDSWVNMRSAFGRLFVVTGVGPLDGLDVNEIEMEKLTKSVSHWLANRIHLIVPETDLPVAPQDNGSIYQGTLPPAVGAREPPVDGANADVS